jgi:nitroreductase
MSIDKSVNTQHPVHELIRKRWSPHAFSNRAVEPDKLMTLLEAASWAASSYNEQPWRFIVATKDNPEAYDRLLSCLVGGNQEWAQQAPVLMITAAKLHFANGNPNRHAFHDVGAAATTLALQAAALGLFIHQMAGLEVEKAQSLLQVPENYEPVAGIALGYLGDPQTLSDRLRDREMTPRSRKSLKEFVFNGQWGNTSLVDSNP